MYPKGKDRVLCRKTPSRDIASNNPLPLFNVWLVDLETHKPLDVICNLIMIDSLWSGD
jgi:hypothetical protein